MSRNLKNSILGIGMAALLSLGLLTPASASAESRKLKSEVHPTYPELARKMSVSGTVKLTVSVSPSGSVTNVKVIGGHPLLVGAAVDAVKRFKYVPAATASTEEVEFKFSPADQ